MKYLFYQNYLIIIKVYACMCNHILPVSTSLLTTLMNYSGAAAVPGETQSPLLLLRWPGTHPRLPAGCRAVPTALSVSGTAGPGGVLRAWAPGTAVQDGAVFSSFAVPRGRAPLIAVILRGQGLPQGLSRRVGPQALVAAGSHPGEGGQLVAEALLRGV